MGVGEVTLGEQVGEDADDIVAELALVAVDPGVEVVTAPGDLGVDEPAPVGVVEDSIRDVTPVMPASCSSQKLRMCAKWVAKLPASASARAAGQG